MRLAALAALVALAEAKVWDLERDFGAVPYVDVDSSMPCMLLQGCSDDRLSNNNCPC